LPHTSVISKENRTFDLSSKVLSLDNKNKKSFYFVLYSLILTNANTYQYLRQYKGLDFLTKHYGVEHTQSIEDAVEDIAIICNRHGGALVL